MGIALFVRNARGVQLTETARDYARAIGPAISDIARASVEVRLGARDRPLRVMTMPAFAQRWLLPRLRDFNERRPDMPVLVSAESGALDLSHSAFDLAIGCIETCSDDCERIDLFAEEIFPVVSAELASRAQLRTHADLLGLEALHDAFWESDWQTWLDAVGVSPPARWRCRYFPLYTLAVDAALAGRGALMGHAALIENELRSGKLIAPFDMRIVAPARYCAVVRRNRVRSPAIRVFLDWLYDIRPQAPVIE